MCCSFAHDTPCCRIIRYTVSLYNYSYWFCYKIILYTVNLYIWLFFFCSIILYTIFTDTGFAVKSSFALSTFTFTGFAVESSFTQRTFTVTGFAAESSFTQSTFTFTALVHCQIEWPLHRLIFTWWSFLSIALYMHSCPWTGTWLNLAVFTLSATILYTAILYWDRSYTEWFDINYFLYMQWIITHSRHLHRDVKHCNPFVQWFFTHMILCVKWSFIRSYI